MFRKQPTPQWSISRRDVLKLGGLAAAGATGLLATPPAAAAGKVVAGSWGGPYTEAQETAFFKPFEEETGIEVEVVTAGNLTASGIKAFIETGYYEWSWTTLGSSDYAVAAKNGWLEAIDYSIVTADDKSPERQFQEFGVGAEAVSDVIAYRTDVFPDGGPRSWADYWDTDRFPGPRGMWKNPFPLLEAALLADGASADDLYPLDLDRAFGKADEVKDAITVWWESGTQSQDIIASKNVVINHMWNGRAGLLKRDGHPIGLTWNEGFYDQGYFVVPKGAPDKENAMKLIDYAAGPRALAIFAENTFYGPSNLSSIALIEADTRKLMNTAPDNLAQQVSRDFVWWSEHLAEVNERFVGWLIS